MLQPEMQKIQKKYKGKNDPASRQQMQQEMMGLYQKHGTNPFSSCLPILAQSPIFFALFRVLYSMPQIADGTYRDGQRSEERRVGTERRSRATIYQERIR